MTSETHLSCEHRFHHIHKWKSEPFYAKNILCSFFLSFFLRNHGHHVFKANDKRHHPGCYQHTFQKLEFVMVRGALVNTAWVTCTSVNHHWYRFGATYAKQTSSSRKAAFIPAKEIFLLRKSHSIYIKIDSLATWLGTPVQLLVNATI